MTNEPTRHLCRFLELMTAPDSDIVRNMAIESLDKLRESIQNQVYPNLETTLFHLNKMVTGGDQ